MGRYMYGTIKNNTMKIHNPSRGLKKQKRNAFKVQRFTEVYVCIVKGEAEIILFFFIYLWTYSVSSKIHLSLSLPFEHFLSE